MVQSFTLLQKSSIGTGDPSSRCDMTGAMKMRIFPLIVAWTFLAVPSAFGQSMPLWKSATQTGNVRDLVLSAGSDNSVAAWLGKKTDTQNGRLQNPVINQRSITTGPLQLSDVGSSLGVAALDAASAVRSVGIANFDYLKIDPSSATGRLLVPVPSVKCPGAMGTTSPAANCLAVRATTGNAVVAQMLSLINEDQTTDASELQVAQAIGVLQDSPNSAAWGQNIVMTQGPGTAGVAGTEIDINRAATCDTATDSWSDPKCPGATGSWITGVPLSGHTGSPGYVLTSASGTTPLFDVGYGIFGNAVRDTGFLDSSSSHTGFRLYNGHTYGFDCSTANLFDACFAMVDANSFTQGRQGIYWFPKSTVAGGDNQTPDGYLTMTSGALRLESDTTGTFSINASADVDTSFDVGSTYHTHTANINLHSVNSGNAYDAQIQSTGGAAGANGGGTLSLTASRIRLNGLLHIQALTKAQILGVANPVEGMIVNDSDDHVPVVYENGHWYPMTLEPALQ